VTSLTGTGNQISVSSSTGAVTLSLPQAISSAASPSFYGLQISNKPAFNIAFTTPGSATPGLGKARFYMNRPGNIKNVTASVSSTPTTNALIVDVRKNTITIYGTNPNARPTIAAGTNADTFSTPDTTGFVAGDFYTVDIVQTGVNAGPGSDLVVQIEYE
jgi:hypothetical protein